jgi:hypothetical protein
MTRPTDPRHQDPTERGTPAGQVEELIEEAEETGASTDPADSEIGEEQQERH